MSANRLKSLKLKLACGILYKTLSYRSVTVPFSYVFKSQAESTCHINFSGISICMLWHTKKWYCNIQQPNLAFKRMMDSGTSGQTIINENQRLTAVFTSQLNVIKVKCLTLSVLFITWLLKAAPAVTDVLLDSANDTSSRLNSDSWRLWNLPVTSLKEQLMLILILRREKTCIVFQLTQHF